MRLRHWCCSGFADLLRGTEKPTALGWNEWKDWHKQAQAAHPYRYYLAEKLLPRLQKMFFFPADCVGSAHSWYHNRFVSKTHCLKTGLKPGVYHELDDRILHGLFNELSCFVEEELAALRPKDNKYEFKKGKCPEAGLDHLDWEASLVYDTEGDPLFGKPTPQAETAKLIKELYLWWRGKCHEQISHSDEEEAEIEEERMLHLLIAIRKRLWT